MPWILLAYIQCALIKTTKISNSAERGNSLRTTHTQPKTKRMNGRVFFLFCSDCYATVKMCSKQYYVKFCICMFVCCIYISIDIHSYLFIFEKFTAWLNVMNEHWLASVHIHTHSLTHIPLVWRRLFHSTLYICIGEFEQMF